MSMRCLLLAALLLLAACGEDTEPQRAPKTDAAADLVMADQSVDQPDTSPDQAAEDIPPDLVEDLAPDLAQDMTPDVAPDMACECNSGPCCDGCMFKGADVVCTDRWTKMVCEGTSSGSATYYNRYCNGLSAACEGRLEERGTLPADCSPGRCRAGEDDRWLICTAG
jgi:hypothetical protein